MTCDDCLELSDDFADGRLAPAAAAGVRLHLEACPACRARTADYARIRAAARELGRLGHVEPPARVWTQVAAAVRTTRPVAGLRSDAGADWHQWLAAAASVALMASSLTWVGSKLALVPPTASTAPPAASAANASVDSSEQFQLAEAAYQWAIDSLEPMAADADADAPVLTEPALVAVHAGLDALDQTIGEARGQLTLEPDDELSRDLLLSALESKVALLQDTVALLDESAASGVNP